jgi:hypothetical protein
MTNYAQIVNGKVVNVIVADADFVAQSNLDYVLLSRGGIGWTYDGTNFIAPQPFKSWTLDNNYDWQAPKPKPDGAYYWDEDLQDWIKIDEA